MTTVLLLIINMQATYYAVHLVTMDFKESACMASNSFYNNIILTASHMQPLSLGNWQYQLESLRRRNKLRMHVDRIINLVPQHSSDPHEMRIEKPGRLSQSTKLMYSIAFISDMIIYIIYKHRAHHDTGPPKYLYLLRQVYLNRQYSDFIIWRPLPIILWSLHTSMVSGWIPNPLDCESSI